MGGRVRAGFLSFDARRTEYENFSARIKYNWEPKNIFNPGKIVDAQTSDEPVLSIRHLDSRKLPSKKTLLGTYSGAVAPGI